MKTEIPLQNHVKNFLKIALGFGTIVAIIFLGIIYLNYYRKGTEPNFDALIPVFSASAIISGLSYIFIAIRVKKF